MFKTVKKLSHALRIRLKYAKQMYTVTSPSHHSNHVTGIKACYFAQDFSLSNLWKYCTKFVGYRTPILFL